MKLGRIGCVGSRPAAALTRVSTRGATRVATAVVFLAIASRASTQQPIDNGVVQDLILPVQSLVLLVRDIGGVSRDLQLRETPTELRIALAADVLFDLDKADLGATAQRALNEVAALLRERATGSVRIEGHTDAKGSDSYNLKLSARRARAVEDWLVADQGLKGTKRLRFTSRGFGETRPVAPNTKPDGTDDPEGRQLNRRVEIVVAK